ncbi:hypothetical protein [Furfurilactobacillus entadae]|uniref:hypothetical protein n=1 Tax=Furfurilactobacillus entadae TaxID=2922307 RepID=UPI0035E8D1E5
MTTMGREKHHQDSYASPVVVKRTVVWGSDPQASTILGAKAVPVNDVALQFDDAA